MIAMISPMIIQHEHISNIKNVNKVNIISFSSDEFNMFDSLG
jgi:hypothetical protein